MVTPGRPMGTQGAAPEPGSISSPRATLTPAVMPRVGLQVSTGPQRASWGAPLPEHEGAHWEGHSSSLDTDTPGHTPEAPGQGCSGAHQPLPAPRLPCGRHSPRLRAARAPLHQLQPSCASPRVPGHGDSGCLTYSGASPLLPMDPKVPGRRASGTWATPTSPGAEVPRPSLPPPSPCAPALSLQPEKQERGLGARQTEGTAGARDLRGVEQGSPLGSCAAGLLGDGPLAIMRMSSGGNWVETLAVAS